MQDYERDQKFLNLRGEIEELNNLLYAKVKEMNERFPPGINDNGDELAWFLTPWVSGTRTIYIAIDDGMWKRVK